MEAGVPKANFTLLLGVRRTGAGLTQQSYPYKSISKACLPDTMSQAYSTEMEGLFTPVPLTPKPPASNTRLREGKGGEEKDEQREKG